MTDYLVLNEFVPGTKAKAEDVNANFSTLKDAINSKASTNGDFTKTFSVANATLPEQAVNKSQLDTTSTDIGTKIDNLLNRFCLTAGNLNAGDADLLGYSGTTLSFKIGGSYPIVKWISANGVQETISTLPNITGLSTNGTYTIIKELNSTNAVATSSKVTQGKVYPTTPADGDYHCLIATDLKTYKRISGAWVETQYIQLGSVIVSNGAITSVSTNPYKQNGYDVNIKSNDWARVLPNYKSPISYAVNTNVTADKEGMVVATGSSQGAGTIGYLYIDSTIVGKIVAGDTYGYSSSVSAYVKKGQIINFTAAGVSGATLTFYPAVGTN